MGTLLAPYADRYSFLASDRAHTVAVLLRFCRACSCTVLSGFYRADTTTPSGSFRKGAEGAHDPLPGDSYRSCERVQNHLRYGTTNYYQEIKPRFTMNVSESIVVVRFRVTNPKQIEPQTTE
jgi:hypothetical protein